MSIRDYPSSTSWFLNRFSGLQLVKAYDPSTGGVGGPGFDRQTLPPWWTQRSTVQDGVAPVPLEASLRLHLDGSRGDTLSLDSERRVVLWRDLSGNNNHAVGIPAKEPKHTYDRSFEGGAVDLTS